MADTQLQLPPGYEDAKPVQAQASGVQLPSGYEDAKPVSATPSQEDKDRYNLSHPEEGKLPRNGATGSSYEMRPVLPSGERVGSMQASPNQKRLSYGEVGSGLWEAANTPLLPEGRMEKDAHEHALEQERMNHPYRSAAYQSAADLGKTARQFLTTPLAAATIGIGPALEEGGTLAKMAGKALPLAFGARGGQEVVQGAERMKQEGVTPENLQQTLEGAGQAAFGGVGAAEGTEVGKAPAKELATAPVRGLGKAYNFATQDVPGAVGYMAAGRPGYYAAKGLAHILPEAGEGVTEYGKTPEATNFDKLNEKAKKAEDVSAKAEAEVKNYAASEERAPGSTPEGVIKKAEKARQLAAEARFHADAAKEALDKSRAPQEPEQPITADHMRGLQNDVDRMAPRPAVPVEGPESAPAQKPINVKGPGEVQPETIQRAPEELPTVPRVGQERLANNQGRMGRTLALPEAPLEGAQEVLPPEKENPQAPTAEKAPTTLEGGFAPLPPEETIRPRSVKKDVEKAGDLVNRGLGNEPMKPGVPLKEQATKIRSEIEPEKQPEAPEERRQAAEETKEPEKLSSDPRKAVLQKAKATPEEIEKILARGTKNDPTSKVGLSKLAESFGVDLGQTAIGRGKGDVAAGTHMAPADVLQKIVDAGHSPSEIAKAIDEGKHLPPVSGGAPSTGYSQKADARYPAEDKEANESLNARLKEFNEKQTKTSAKDNEHMEQAKKELGPDAYPSDYLKRAQELKNKASGPVDVAKSADDFNKAEGLPKIKPEKVEKDSKAAQIADDFDKMKHDPSDPAVKKSYDALIDDVKKQWDYATKKMGINIEPTDQDPYGFNGDKPADAELFDDVKNNKHLGVWRGGNPLPEDHPLAKVDPETGESYNTMLRAVHDIFGHAAQGHDFSEPGEESAWNVHKQMMSPEAVPAMTTETRGQTSWFFNNKGVRGGEPLGKFADQKAGLLPEYANERTPEAKDTLDHIKSGKDYSILTAENPDNTRISDEENATRNRKLMAELREKGYKPVPVEGNTKDVEGRTEHSFFVPDITPKDAAELAKKHGQAAVLTTEGLHDLKTDTVNPTDNEKIKLGAEARKEPYYTKIGDQDFSVPVDFSKTVAPKGRLAADIGKWQAPPELGAFSAEDVGSKVRAKNPEPTGRGSDKAMEQAQSLSGRRTGQGIQEGQTEQRSGKDRRDFDRSKQTAEDNQFKQAVRELGLDASDDDITKRIGEIKDRPKATTETAKMGDDELLKNGFTRDDIENGRHLPSVSGAAPKKGQLPSGEDLIKRYGESDGDPAHTAFLLNDGKGVAQTGTLHDVMLGGKPTDNLREQFIAKEGAIRMRASGVYGDRQISMSLPEKGISQKQFDQIVKWAPQMSTGKVYMETVGPEGASNHTVIDVPHEEFHGKLESSLRDMVPVLNDKGTPVDEFGNPTVSGGSQAAGTAKAKTAALPKIAEENITPEEKAGVTKSEAGRKSFVEHLKALPSVQEFVDIAKAGEGGKDWYSRSAKAFDALHEEAPKYFQEGDRAKFTDFVAALSPQQTVAMNLREALNAWTKYVDEGRPTGKPLEKLLKNELTMSGAKVPNATKALAGEPLWPDLSKNSNFKVPSFAKNLQGYLNHVTNDGWQGLFGGLDSKELSKPTSYHPLSVVTRAAADALGWDPAQAQAAIWAFTKVFTEKGETDPKIIRRYSEDFADIMANDSEVRQQLAQLGVNHEQLDAKLRAIGRKPTITPGASSTTERSIGKLASRIETARGKGTIPPPKSGYLDYGEPGEDEENTSFNPNQFHTQTSEQVGKKSKLGRIGK